MKETVRMFVEIPAGSTLKYEYHSRRCVLVIDRILDAPIPFNYGFMKSSLWHDGDPLDIVLVGLPPVQPGTEIDVVPIGLVKMIDNGESDYKLVCTLGSLATSGKIVPRRELKAVVEYLRTYKPGIVIEGTSWTDSTLERVVRQARQMLKDELKRQRDRHENYF